MTLESLQLSTRELIDLAKHVGNGKAGFDYARSSKAEIVMYLEGKYNPETIAASLAALWPDKAQGAPVPPPAATPVVFLPSQAVPRGTPAQGDAVTALAKALRDVVGEASPVVDEDAVRRIVTEEVGKQAPREIAIRVGNAAPVPITGAHPLATKVAALVAAGVNVALTGPAGTGKTTMGKVVATMLGRPHSSISLSAGITEAHLLGRLLPVGEGGRFHWVPSPFLMRYAGMRLDYATMAIEPDEQQAGVFTFDEFDAADPNMLLVVNSATANHGFDVEGRLSAGLDPFVTRSARCGLLANLNTYGTGPTAQYVGRGALDAATLDRWYMVALDYDAAYEASIFGGKAPIIAPWEPVEAPSPQDLRALGEWAQNVRVAVRARGLTRIVSTRFIQKAIAARSAGVDSEDVKRDLLTGWSVDDMKALGALAPVPA